MTTIYTYNDLKRMFYTYNYGRSKITFDETYEMFDDMNLLHTYTKDDFKYLCETHDKNKDGLMDCDEIYQIYKYMIGKITEW